MYLYIYIDARHLARILFFEWGGKKGKESAQLLRYATIPLIYSGVKLGIVQVGVVDITAMPEFTSGNFSVARGAKNSARHFM